MACAVLLARGSPRRATRHQDAKDFTAVRRGENPNLFLASWCCDAPPEPERAPSHRGPRRERASPGGPGLRSAALAALARRMVSSKREGNARRRRDRALGRHARAVSGDGTRAALGRCLVRGRRRGCGPRALGRVARGGARRGLRAGHGERLRARVQGTGLDAPRDREPLCAGSGRPLREGARAPRRCDGPREERVSGVRRTTRREGNRPAHRDLARGAASSPRGERQRRIGVEARRVRWMRDDRDRDGPDGALRRRAPRPARAAASLCPPTPWLG